MDGSVDRDTPDELSFSGIVVTVYFIWGVVFLLLVLALCVVGLVPPLIHRGRDTHLDMNLLRTKKVSNIKNIITFKPYN